MIPVLHNITALACTAAGGGAAADTAAVAVVFKVHSFVFVLLDYLSILQPKTKKKRKKILFS